MRCRDAAVALVLMGCGAPERPASTPSSINVSIGAAGAAGLTHALPMSVEAIAAAAPGYTIAEQAPGQTITLSDASGIVFTVTGAQNGSKIGEISTRSAVARGPQNDIIGRAKFGDALASEVMFCTTETAGFACSNAESGVFWRVYALPQSYRGPREPFTAIEPEAALAATLVEMRWRAP